MKKAFTLFAALVLCCSVHAQRGFYPSYNQHEVSLSYGRVSVPSFAYTFGGILGSVFGFGSIKPEKMYSVGAMGLEYMYYANPHIAVGGGATYEIYNLTFAHKTGTDGNGNDIYESGRPSLNHIVSVMPAVKFLWFNGAHASMYSKFAAGLMTSYNPGYIAEKDGKTEKKDPSFSAGLAAQVTPVGLDFGGTRFRGFAELGVGMQGLFIFGLRYGF